MSGDEGLELAADDVGVVGDVLQLQESAQELDQAPDADGVGTVDVAGCELNVRGAKFLPENLLQFEQFQVADRLAEGQGKESRVVLEQGRDFALNALAVFLGVDWLASLVQDDVAAELDNVAQVELDQGLLFAAVLHLAGQGVDDLVELLHGSILEILG